MTEHILLEYRDQISEEAFERLQGVAEQMELIADLNEADMFIDCLRQDGVAVVIAQAKPRGAVSNYRGSAVGNIARREDEPAVYRAFESGLPVQDLKAVTQERRSVMQDVAPIRTKSGALIGVLIAERDVTSELRRERKLRSLETREDAEKLQPSFQGNELIFREMNHRIKNQLQMLSSQVRIRSRNSAQAETRETLQALAAQIDTIAASYDSMTHSGKDMIPVLPLLERAAVLFRTLNEEKHITVEVTGEPISLPGEQAIALSIAAGELLVNARKHGFAGRTAGKVTMNLQSGNAVRTLKVSDDGVGFHPNPAEATGGMRLISCLVREKLKGEIRWFSDQNGTSATITIPKEK